MINKYFLLFSRGEKNLSRIEDDIGELDYLQNQLSRMDGLSDELVIIFNFLSICISLSLKCIIIIIIY